MTSLEAMKCVQEHLDAGDIVGAQAVVMVIESERSILPSSTFERVLRAAVKADCLTEDYSEWCMRAYGRTQFVQMLANACAE